ncbi:hypothetical protein Tco_0630460, partial [Tanacetum coccineum]
MKLVRHFIILRCDEIYARASKEESDMTTELNKIEKLTSIAQLQEDFKVMSSQILPQRKSLELVMGVKLDVTCEAGALNLALFDKEAHPLCVLLLLLSMNPNQPSITFLDMVDATLDAADIYLMKNSLINKFSNHH